MIRMVHHALLVVGCDPVLDHHLAQPPAQERLSEELDGIDASCDDMKVFDRGIVAQERARPLQKQGSCSSENREQDWFVQGLADALSSAKTGSAYFST